MVFLPYKLQHTGTAALFGATDSAREQLSDYYYYYCSCCANYRTVVLKTVCANRLQLVYTAASSKYYNDMFKAKTTYSH